MLVDLLNRGALKVTFAYDARLVQLIKRVPGKRWNPDDKYWTIPPTGLRPLQQEAARLGVTIRVTERVEQALNLGEERRQKLIVEKTDTSPFPLPTDTVPYDYQYSGIRFLKYALHNFKGALLADDMGLGKTFMSLALIVMHEKVRTVLILVPATLKYVWAAEIEKHFPQLTYTVIDGKGGTRIKSAAEVREEQWAEDTRIKICNYELLLRDVFPRLMEWDLVIADEATRLKNYRKTRTVTRTENGKEVRKRTVTTVGRAKALNRKYTIALSGAPVENKLEELWSIMDFAIEGVLGEGYVFVQQHVVKDRWGGFIRYQGIQQVKERIEPFYIRRRKSEVLKDLPDKVYSDVKVELSYRGWAFYGPIQRQIREEIADNPTLTASNILTMMLRLKQAVDDPRLLGEKVKSTKTAMIGDIIEGAGEHKIVFFTQFSEYADLLNEQFDEGALIAGHVDAKTRMAIINTFQMGEYPYLFCTEAAAYGVTLTAADIIVHIDQPWNPARMRQREDRLHRIGQENSVQVVTMRADRTIDTYVQKILHQKMQLIKQVLDDDIPDEDSAKLNRAELMGLLGVDEDAA